MLYVTARPRWKCICQVVCVTQIWGSWYLCQQKKLLLSAYATSVPGRFAPQLCQPSYSGTFVSVAWQDLRVVIFITCSDVSFAHVAEGYFSITSIQTYSYLWLLVTHIYFMICSDKSLKDIIQKLQIQFAEISGVINKQWSSWNLIHQKYNLVTCFWLWQMTSPKKHCWNSEHSHLNSTPNLI